MKKKLTARAGLTGILILSLICLAIPGQLEAGHKCGHGHCKGGGLSLFHSGKCCSPWKLGHKHKCKPGCGGGSCGSGSLVDQYYQGAVYGMGNSSRGGCQSCQSGSDIADFDGLPAGDLSPQPDLQMMPVQSPPMRPRILHYPGTMGT
ncbi:MAG TPA: hypothetical protein DCM07_17030, partial [Planctomycetaceae bacterium]|nr:hypothetical protein [Planctomycetaceae bacterium]